MSVHAGHGLDFETTATIKALPYLEEVNIGHFLVCDALNNGFYESVRKMKEIIS
jgi:pyridoxine 5-phosphate synthase